MTGIILLNNPKLAKFERTKAAYNKAVFVQGRLKEVQSAIANVSATFAASGSKSGDRNNNEQLIINFRCSPSYPGQTKNK